MSKLLEFFLGSLLIAVLTVALIFFSALQYLLRMSNISDCMWQGSIRTWVDSNGNGQMDHAEVPLAGVLLHVNDVQNELVDVAWPVIADQDGEARFNAPIPECLDTVFEIHVDLPAGYQLTTSPRLEIHSDVWQSLTARHIYYFGFVPSE